MAIEKDLEEVRVPFPKEGTVLSGLTLVKDENGGFAWKSIGERAPVYRVTFYEMTLSALNENGKKPDDIKWLGTCEWKMTWHQFCEASQFEYRDFHTDLDIYFKIVGSDWVLILDEYDGMWSWRFHSLKEPDICYDGRRLG